MSKKTGIFPEKRGKLPPKQLQKSGGEKILPMVEAGRGRFNTG
jgi:hypothetical protein